MPIEFADLFLSHFWGLHFPQPLQNSCSVYGVLCRFLFDESCADYKYYEYRIAEEEKVISQTREYQTSRIGWYLDFSILISGVKDTDLLFKG